MWCHKLRHFYWLKVATMQYKSSFSSPWQVHGLGLAGAVSHSAETHSSAYWRALLEGANRTTSSIKKQWLNPVVYKPDSLQPPAGPKNPVDKTNEEDRWQRSALPESNIYWEQFWLAVSTVGPSSCSSRTKTGQPLGEGLWPHTAEAPPTECCEGHGQMPSSRPQIHVDWLNSHESSSTL